MIKSSSICQACVSQDRRLYRLACLRNILQQTISELTSSEGSVCWECANSIIKFYKFKQNVQKTQRLLLHCDKLEDLTCTSSLGFKINCDPDYMVEYGVDPRRVNTNMKAKEMYLDNNFRQDKDTIDKNDKIIKEELRPPLNVCKEATDNIHVEKYKECTKELDNDVFNSSDDLPLAEAAKDTYRNIIVSKKINLKRNESIKYKKNCYPNTNENNLKKKYVKIVYTEEEMVNKRDRKKNGSNFKVLPYKCDLCVLGFKRKDYYDNHVDKKHNEKIGDYRCPVCSIRFESQIKLERHKKRHYVCYRCCFCKYKTTAMVAILKHCRSKHSADKPGSIHCTYCDEIVKTPEQMFEHKVEQHPLYCDECCGEKFVSAESLRSHKRRIHNSKRQFLCTVCSKPFKTKSKLESHTASYHTDVAQKLSYCQLCNIQYKNIYVYRNHLRNSALHSDEAHQCSECSRKFASKVYLRKHYNFYHLQKSQYKCEQCSKLFISDYRLKNHKRTQHGVSSTRDYHCNVCGKQFFTQTTLKGHQQIHSEHRAYMCEDCGDTFKQRPALYNHHRLVHRGASNKNKERLARPQIK